MDKIKAQANTVSKLVLSKETGELYTKTLTRTWEILRETGILIWLVICLTFVGGEWFYRTAVDLGQKTRVWYNGLGETPSADADAASVESTGQALLSTVQSGAAYLLSQARQQLGLKEPEPTTPPVTPPAKPVNVVPPKVTVTPEAISLETASESKDKDEDEAVDL
ncbi:MAG: hypothetical protein ACFCVD_06485 [Nodosilinea sp.]